MVGNWFLRPLRGVARLWVEAGCVQRNGLGATRFQAFRVLVVLRVKMSRGDKPGVRCRTRIFGRTIEAFTSAELLNVFREIFVRGDYTFVSEHDAPLIFDCGANVGMSVLFFKMRYPNAVIRAFEPNPEIFAVLKRNVETNSFRSVTLNNEALLDEESVVPFYLGSLGGSLGGSIRRVGDDSGVVEVQAVPTVRSPLVPRVLSTLVKIDVREGAETEIVTDLQAAGLLSRPRRFIIEYHPERIGGGRRGSF